MNCSCRLCGFGRVTFSEKDGLHARIYWGEGVPEHFFVGGRLVAACCEESPCATKGSKLLPPGAGGDCHSKSEGSADRNPSLRDGHEVGEQPFLDDFREFLKIWSMAAPFLR